MSRDFEQILQTIHRVTIRFGPRELPRSCPCCGVRLVWGWVEEEFWTPNEPDAVYLHRIPRPDQTLFCPRCEDRILN